VTRCDILYTGVLRSTRTTTGSTSCSTHCPSDRWRQPMTTSIRARKPRMMFYSLSLHHPPASTPTLSTDFISIKKKHPFLARDVIYTSHAYAMMPVRLSVRLSVTEVHWRIIANLGFKFRSDFTAHWPPCCCGRHAAGGRRAACGRIISRHASQC